MSVKGIRIFLLLAEDVHKFYQYDQIKVYINTNKLNLWNFENESCIKIHQLRTTLISNSYICIILVNNKNFWQVGKDKWSLQSNTHTLTAYSLRTLGILSSNVKLKKMHHICYNTYMYVAKSNVSFRSALICRFSVVYNKK